MILVKEGGPKERKKEERNIRGRKGRERKKKERNGTERIESDRKGKELASVMAALSYV
jgi:hypothetical protein